MVKYTKEDLKKAKDDVKLKKLEVKKLRLEAKAEREGKIAEQYEKIAQTKEKLKEYRGKKPIVKTARAFGEGVIVGIKKGAAAIKKEAPRSARALSAVVGQTGKTKVGVPSIFANEGFSPKTSESYFGSGGLFGGMNIRAKQPKQKETSYFGSEGLFGRGLFGEVTIGKPRIKRYKRKKKRR